MLQTPVSETRGVQTNDLRQESYQGVPNPRGFRIQPVISSFVPTLGLSWWSWGGVNMVEGNWDIWPTS